VLGLFDTQLVQLRPDGGGGGGGSEHACTAEATQLYTGEPACIATGVPPPPPTHTQSKALPANQLLQGHAATHASDSSPHSFSHSVRSTESMAKTSASLAETESPLRPSSSCSADPVRAHPLISTSRGDGTVRSGWLVSCAGCLTGERQQLGLTLG
jgi:hypothetical protein